MAADVATALKTWSTTNSSNSPAGTTVISTNLDDNLREIQAVVRDLASPNTIAAAASMDLGAVDETFLTTTGTAETITAFGTVSAGIYKWVIFNAAHVLTHNATTLILPGAANITAADKDVGLFVSLGSGNWRCLSYTRASGAPVATTLAGLTLTSPTINTPAITSPTITGSITQDAYTPAAGASFTIDLADGGVQRISTNANVTITLPTVAAGLQFTLIVAYGGTHTVTWSGSVVWPAGTAPTATSAIGRYDVYHFVCDGTRIYGTDGGRNLGL